MHREEQIKESVKIFCSVTTPFKEFIQLLTVMLRICDHFIHYSFFDARRDGDPLA